jgi:hypothetical protein
MWRLREEALSKPIEAYLPLRPIYLTKRDSETLGAYRYWQQGQWYHLEGDPISER